MAFNILSATGQPIKLTTLPEEVEAAYLCGAYLEIHKGLMEIRLYFMKKK